ncbi:MAG: ABC transporter permease subunit [Proteobacteria bacterium]|nr:ABC transporter permease subunit [Pseudomonadota bacterium]
MAVTDTADLLERVQPLKRLGAGWSVWIVTGGLAVLLFILSGQIDWMASAPKIPVLAVADWINLFMDWFVDNFRGLFKAISWALQGPMGWLRGLLLWLPWPATVAIVAIICHAVGGWRLALFATGATLYMVVVGYWTQSMNTLALVGVAVPLALILGLSLGILGHQSARARRVIEPLLDLMQTIPTFAYLIPILLLFGFGPVVGLIASAIYAAPPMVRNVMLGLSRVPTDIVESARMSGATERQMLWWVKVPSALPTIMIGVNQTIMAALAMVIIAAVIGSSGDIGWEVLSTMRKARFGESLLAGFVIVLMAMILDRASRRAAENQGMPKIVSGNFFQRHTHLWIALGVAVVMIVLAEFFSPLRDYPKSWVFQPAEPLNNAVKWLNVTLYTVTETIRNWSFYYFLLPIRLGLENSVRPFSWGFEMTLPVKIGYAALVAAISLAAYRFMSWRVAVAVVLVAGLLYFGVTKAPWPVIILVVTVLAWRVGDWKVALFALVGMLFMLLTGVWGFSMQSVYLCGAAVLICFVVGGLLGVWAASNDRVSTFMRPINDTLQTIPLFVFLIPIVMFFSIGDFTAMLAIIAYAIVPVIRYTEHGLRNVPPDIVEAARALGCTERQVLFQVKLPLALPEIMLGLNQTVLFGLAMLVIASLVGTKGLGFLIYVALSNADFGAGAVAGLSMAFIAMITDRIIQSWSHKKKIELGLA